MTVREYLNGINPLQYHVFDSHQEMSDGLAVDLNDRDYQQYSYNIHKNNKPKPGDVFLYRRPGKSTTNRKFNIYGGGVIDKITELNDKGDVQAVIRTAFRLKEPIEQGEARIENFIWTSKDKEPGGSWRHFWSQYGMNVINEHDFYSLVGDLEVVVPGDIDPWNGSFYEASEGCRDTVTGLDLTGFRVEIDTNNMEESDFAFWAQKVLTLKGGDFNFELFQNATIPLELAGILLVLEILIEQEEDYYEIEHWINTEHLAKTEGNAETETPNYKYDLKIITVDNKEIWISVKTTKSQYSDGFYLTPRELNAARQCLYNEAKKTKRYMIFRVYNLDVEKRTANIKIYDRFDDKDFRLERIGWKVHIR